MTPQPNIVDFKNLSPAIQQLIEKAREARENAYCPYSNFAVGAALLTEDTSEIYTGCNIENAAHSPTICAERTAICKAVSDRHTKFVAMAVVAHQDEEFTAPCGVCRQTINEFRSKTGDVEVYISKPQLDRVLHVKISELLPHAFFTYKA